MLNSPKLRKLKKLGYFNEENTKKLPNVTGTNYENGLYYHPDTSPTTNIAIIILILIIGAVITWLLVRGVALLIMAMPHAWLAVK
jgi:hypothetical protein